MLTVMTDIPNIVADNAPNISEHVIIKTEEMDMDGGFSSTGWEQEVMEITPNTGLGRQHASLARKH